MRRDEFVGVNDCILMRVSDGQAINAIESCEPPRRSFDMSALFSALVAVALTLGPILPGWAADAPRVHVAQGWLQGRTHGAVDVFLGVPYAAPPVGRYRWRAPRPAKPWRGLRRADHFGPSCWQPVVPNGFGPWTWEYFPHGAIGENCLYLNVWTPRKRASRLAVLVWIPGGGFIGGSGSVPIYNGTRLATRGIVVVTVNYRLGPFGFLVTPALAAQARRDHAPPGNYGLQDVIAALRWVHRNIAAFGGNPRAVTIAGQSAGAISVQDLLVSPLAVGLYQRAIAESGLPTTVPSVRLAQAERTGQAFMRSHGVKTLNAFRALLPQSLESTGLFMSGPRFFPIIDGEVVPAPVDRLIAEARAHNVPVLIGMNANERSASSPLTQTLSKRLWHAFLRKQFGTMAARFGRLYPAKTGAQRALAKQALQADLGRAALYRWARLWLSRPHASVYAYLWTHAEPGPQSAKWGAFHSSEIPYAFDTLDRSSGRSFTAVDRAIARRMCAYWVNFVNTGDPNGPRLPMWPRLAHPQGPIMRLGARMKPESMLAPRVLSAMRIFMAHGGRAGLF